MPIPRTATQTVAEMHRWKTHFEEAARKRLPQWVEHGEGDVDYQYRVIYEILMSLSERLDALEEILKPEPQGAPAKGK